MIIVLLFRISSKKVSLDGIGGSTSVEKEHYRVQRNQDIEAIEREMIGSKGNLDDLRAYARRRVLENNGRILNEFYNSTAYRWHK